MHCHRNSGALNGGIAPGASITPCVPDIVIEAQRRNWEQMRIRYKRRRSISSRGNSRSKPGGTTRDRHRVDSKVVAPEANQQPRTPPQPRPTQPRAPPRDSHTRYVLTCGGSIIGFIVVAGTATETIVGIGATIGAGMITVGECM